MNGQSPGTASLARDSLHSHNRVVVEAFEDLGAIALEEVDVVGIQDVGQEGVAEIVAGSFGVVLDGEGFSDWTAGMGGVELAIVDLQSSIGHCSIKPKRRRGDQPLRRQHPSQTQKSLKSPSMGMPPVLRPVLPAKAGAGLVARVGVSAPLLCGVVFVARAVEVAVT